MKRLRRVLPLLAVLVLLGLATVLALLAVDVRSWQRTLTQEDLRFAARPSHATTPGSPAILPGDPARVLLGLGDALAYRRALQLFWANEVGTNPANGQDLTQAWAETQEKLQALADDAATRVERSNAANLLGVMTVRTPAQDTATQAQTLRRAAAYFRRAIAEDPANYDAKLNLELVLRLGRSPRSPLEQDAHGGYGAGPGEGAGPVGGGF